MELFKQIIKYYMTSLCVFKQCYVWQNVLWLVRFREQNKKGPSHRAFSANMFLQIFINSYFMNVNDYQRTSEKKNKNEEKFAFLSLLSTRSVKWFCWVSLYFIWIFFRFNDFNCCCCSPKLTFSSLFFTIPSTYFDKTYTF